MKCKFCGGEIDNNSKTCPFCGSTISLEEKIELEQLNKQGCPKCGSGNVAFKREQAGVARNSKGSKTLYQTKGICNDCGHTWTTDTPKKSKIWLWVLGWIFIFPVPLTILLLRKKAMKPGLKYGLIGGSWLIFLLFALIGNVGNAETNVSGIVNTQGSETVIVETESKVSAEMSITKSSVADSESITVSTTEVTSTSSAYVATTTKNETERVVSTKPTEEKVWISSKGKKYHTSRTCSNMKKAKQVTLKEAKKKGYKPCKKCAA